MEKYSIGIDFGTLSARAVLVNVKNGKILSESEFIYPHGVIEESMPDGTLLPEGFSLQHPEDYLDALKKVIPELLKNTGVERSQIVGIGTDFTSSTMLSVLENGTPLCFLPEYKNNPFAYAILWKHHASQKAADRINLIAKKTNQPWLDNFGGKISSEWGIPKLLQIYQENREIYDRMSVWIEAADWIVWMLTGIESHSYSTMEFKTIWDQQTGFPTKDFFRKVEAGFEEKVIDKLGKNFLPVAAKAGGLTAKMAEMTGLSEGTPVSTGMVDAYASLPAVGIDQPGKMLLIVGTSVCEILVEQEGRNIPGLCGKAKDGILPGFFAHEGAQSAGGDILAWFVNHCCSEEYVRESRQRKVSRHQILTEKAEKMEPGESGLIALDWWNGNNCILDDMYLSGCILGMTLSTRSEDIYRALIESIAFGTRVNVEQFVKYGVRINEVLASGGICKKNPLMMQIYADVLNIPISVSKVSQGPALGSAMFGTVAAGKDGGGYNTIFEAVTNMKAPIEKVYYPIPQHVQIYNCLYEEYRKLHDYFGLGINRVMYHLHYMKEKVRR